MIRIKRSHIKGPWASGGNYLSPLVDPTLTPVARTGISGTITLVAGDLNAITTNTGTTNILVLALPSATLDGVDNKALKVQMTGASNIAVVPASGESIYLGGSGAANSNLIIPNTSGNYADLYCDGSQWMVVGYSGALTKT